MEKEVEERFERLEKNLEKLEAQTSRNATQIAQLTTNVAVMQGALANLIDILTKQHGNGHGGG
jgi:chaperonin cofactor prefoldin